jgi:hypothetical protein
VKQRFAMLLIFVLVIVALVGLNAASYRQKQQTIDSESSPNRSSFNSGATGTEAWYSLLAETGRKVTRWQEAPASLLTSKASPAVFVLVGSLRRGFTDKEAETVLEWVNRGGRLVLIDREPTEKLTVTTADWKISAKPSVPELEIFSVDPSDRQQMTQGITAVHPSQPSVFTQGVNAVQFSRFAEKIEISPEAAGETSDNASHGPDDLSAASPIVQISQNGRNYVVDAPFGTGRIILVCDPYIVSNAGISLADNAAFANNLVATQNGTIAFDEFHQGYANDSNRFLAFFAGTPVVAIFLQGLVLVGLVFYSKSRRFARALPEQGPDRLSKLEYVTAMAELQQRTRAWDLAMENIYTDFRRRAARSFGIDVGAATSDVLAKRVGGRTGLDPASVRETLFKCEEIIRGERTDKHQVVRLVDSLRDIEQRLNLRRGRDGK